MFKLTTLIVIAALLSVGTAADFDSECDVGPRVIWPYWESDRLNFLGFCMENLLTYFIVTTEMADITDPDSENPHDSTGSLPYGFNASSGGCVGLYFGPGISSIQIDSDFWKTTSFDLKTFKFGCVVGINGVAYGISRCRLAVFGYRAGKRVATQAFSFLPTKREKTGTMMQATLSSSFRKVEIVRFATVYAPSVQLLSKTTNYTGSTWFDDMDITSYTD